MHSNRLKLLIFTCLGCFADCLFEAVPIALPNTVSPGGYTESWAAGVRAPSINVALSAGWSNATLEGWTMGLTALFPQE